MMKKEAEHLTSDVGYNYKHITFAQSCAEHVANVIVLQHVEAEALGCCTRSCGFKGHMCLLWPFFLPKGESRVGGRALC